MRVMIGVTDHQRGDTLIEVIVATAVLSMIIVLSLGVMNGGTLQSQRAVEETFVRQEIDSQADLLRMARDAAADGDTKAWVDIGKKKRTDTVLPFTELASSNCLPKNPERAFYVVTNGTDIVVKDNFTTSPTYAQAGSGLWIESTSPTNANFTDFYIYACWSAPASGPKATSGTIVRLYAA